MDLRRSRIPGQIIGVGIHPEVAQRCLLPAVPYYRAITWICTEKSELGPLAVHVWLFAWRYAGLVRAVLLRAADS